MKQQHLEQQSKQKAKDRYAKTVAHYRENEQETETAVGRLSLSKLTPHVEQALETWIQEAHVRAGKQHACLPLFLQLPVETSALLISRAVLDSISTAKSITAIHKTIGNAISQEVRLKKFEELNPKLFKSIQSSVWKQRGTQRQSTFLIQALKKSMSKNIHHWSIDEQLRVGIVGLDIFIKATGVVEIQTFYNPRRNRNTSVLVATDDMNKWLNSAHSFRQELKPMHSPMVDYPVEWQAPEVGGYLNNPLKLVKNTEDLSAFTPEAMPKVYEAINKVQSTTWAVNNNVLDVVNHLYKYGVEVKGLPSSQPIPFPTIPSDIETNTEARKRYGAERAKVLNTNNKLRSKKLSVAKLLQEAKQFSKVKEFYLPQQLDFRGRMYSVPVGLNNQGGDLSRALLQFSVGKTIDKDKHMELYQIKGANHYGLSNLNFNDRLKWVEDNFSLILNAGCDPLDYLDFWAEAKEPFQFLAWIIEFARVWHDDSELSYLPCHIDGTNNGCQIWSLLLRDEKTGHLTNCSYSEDPQDLYQVVADDLINNLDDSFYGQEWRRIGIDRSTVKGAVMIVPYSATLTGVSNTIFQWLQAKRDEGVTFSWQNDYSGANYLAKILWEILPIHIPAVLQGKDFLQSCVTAASKVNKPISWLTPVGIEVKNAYYKKNARKLRTRLGQRYHVSYVQESTPSLSNRRQRQTVTANFTHSFDATLMIETICRAKATHLSMVHDSYGCHASDLPDLIASVKTSASELFSENILEKFHASLCEQIPEANFPQPPNLGKLRPSSVLNSLYFFN